MEYGFKYSRKFFARLKCLSKKKKKEPKQFPNHRNTKLKNCVFSINFDFAFNIVKTSLLQSVLHK